MKITGIELFDCELRRFHPDTQFNPIIIRVLTDAGLRGLGEVGLAYGAGANAGAGMVRDLAPYVLGKDPMKVEAIWENLFRSTFWGMSGGPVVYGAISAIDIALWDIRGKALGVPIHQLLGGKTNDNLRTYASQLQHDWTDKYVDLARPEEYAAAARRAVALGYDAIKVDPIQVNRAGQRGLVQGFFGLLKAGEVRMGVERIAAMREAVGPDVDIICEIHSALGTNSAIQFGRAIEQYNIFYYEEPVHPMNANAFARIAEKTTLPLATGERSYTRWGYRALLEKQALAVVQPDLCLAGGITEGKKICDYANLYDATVQIHVCGSPVSTAAALQVEAVIPNFIIHEHHTIAIKPALRELAVPDYQPADGRFKVPDLPGLGLELNEAAVARYRSATITE
jgi:galactonate dehydratase